MSISLDILKVDGVTLFSPCVDLIYRTLSAARVTV